MVRIRRFGVVRTASVVALMYFVLFAIILVPVLLLAGSFRTSGDLGGDAAEQFGPLGFAAVGLLGALLYAVVGWVFVALTCLLYNFVARFTGGIEVQVERFEPPAGPPLPATWGPRAERTTGGADAPVGPPGGGTGAGGS